jgi:Uma2 family endonuclease
MSTDILSTDPIHAATPPAGSISVANAPTVLPALRADVIIEDKKIMIPGWVNTLDEYRRWAESDDYPANSWISYLNGVIFVDPSMEEFLSHNRVKYAFNTMFGMLLLDEAPGCFVPDRMLLVNEAANLSTEPDGLFYLWATMQTGRLRLVPGKKAGYMQLEGTPDVVLEIVSDGSVAKDLVQLRPLYWKARIPEYWLVDARHEAIQFDIFRHDTECYHPTEPINGWLRSEILGKSFRLTHTADPLGLPQFVVEIQP